MDPVIYSGLTTIFMMAFFYSIFYYISDKESQKRKNYLSLAIAAWLVFAFWVYLAFTS